MVNSHQINSFVDNTAFCFWFFSIISNFALKPIPVGCLKLVQFAEIDKNTLNASDVYHSSIIRQVMISQNLKAITHKEVVQVILLPFID